VLANGPEAHHVVRVEIGHQRGAGHLDRTRLEPLRRPQEADRGVEPSAVAGGLVAAQLDGGSEGRRQGREHVQFGVALAESVHVGAVEGGPHTTETTIDGHQELLAP
jgi:hypothetical protein